ncbi:hypothetical protein GCM10009681_53710 [Luedemannella helvata]|uniref:Uncharacterized protein n=1 Tax=Luedemannella helvata TaxID=349315 RepID=A0ABP4XF32_9ACTN
MKQLTSPSRAGNLMGALPSRCGLRHSRDKNWCGDTISRQLRVHLGDRECVCATIPHHNITT